MTSSVLLAFLHHAAAFLLVAAVLGWRKTLRQGRIPLLDERRRRTLGRLVHLELGLLFVIMLCAALMARGVGTFG